MAISRGSRTNCSSDKPVQERLLDAAEELFCERGFEGTSVRDIAGAADCNIASVNYYFGRKDNLYLEVWRRHLIPIRDIRIASIKEVMSQSGGKPSLEELLSAFANAFIGPLVDENKVRRLTRLMSREMLDQHLPASMFGEEIIAPTMAAMHQALLRVCPQLEQSKIPFVVLSVVGQLVHTIHIRAMFEKMDSPELPKFDLPEMIDHIVKFSVAGVRAYGEEKME